MKRLVSALYDDFYPFSGLADNHLVTTDPDDLLEGDCLIVWGGGDIHPDLYNKGRSQKSHAGNQPCKRDLIEWALMQRAKELKIPIIGVCRGAQMLCALEGGYLIQHINNHGGWGHDVTTADGKSFHVNSIHHQMMMPHNTKHELVAWSSKNLSDVYYDVDDKVEVDKEPEFVFFPEVKGFAVQWHPEAMMDSSDATKYVLNFIKERA